MGRFNAWDELSHFGICDELSLGTNLTIVESVLIIISLLIAT